MITKSPVFHNEGQRTRWMNAHYWRLNPAKLDRVNIPIPQEYPCLLIIAESQKEIAVEYVYLSDLETLKVGAGATAYIGSDRYPYTIIKVISPKKLVLQADDYKRTDKNGLSENQTYEYTPNPNGSEVVVTLRQNGRWVQEGESMKNGRGFFIGERQAYQDPSF